MMLFYSTRYFLILSICLNVALGLSSNSITYRAGRKSDEWRISTTLAKELMNPLNIDASRFVVAVDQSGKRERLAGWAQLRPLGASTALTDPNQFNAPPGSLSIDDAVDDTLWQGFEEDDSVAVPSGWASLPWTKEYRAFTQQATTRRGRRKELLQQLEHDETSAQLWELASVYVNPDYRQQGLGAEVVRKCLQNHVQAPVDDPHEQQRPIQNVYLLSLLERAPWYTKAFGFEIVSDEKDIPKYMQLELAAGRWVAELLGEELCCMRASPATLEHIEGNNNS
ncbi:hypothetical protein MPSEU_001012200 [Mayamaea pseudoterrestris]|nr:hypothetical protein MPSEU_001012200 [Mayamaea pseudoterrestris]